MHRAERYLERVYFGYDQRQFYVRFDLAKGQRKSHTSGGSIQLWFVAPADLRLSCALDEAGKWQCRVLRSPIQDLQPGFAGARILEIGIPLDALGIRQSDEVRFFVSVLEKENELERFPSSGFLVVPVDPWGLDQRDWVV